MLLRKSRSTRFIGVMVAGIIFAAIAMFMIAPSAQAEGYGGCNWSGSYWNNRDLHGHPTVQRCDSAIDFDWHGLSPDPSIHVDDFSARWVRTYHFDTGTYRFKATMDDGMRVYLDGKMIIDDWQEGNVRTREADIHLYGGAHKLVVEYFEKGGNAIAGFTWSSLSGSSQPYPKPLMAKPPMYSQPPMEKPMPPTSGVDYPVAEVKASYLNVRSGPGVDYNVVGVLHRNDKVRLVARSAGGKWVMVQNQALNGWVNRYYLATDFPYTSLPVAGSGHPQPPKPEQPVYYPSAVVNASVLNVRSGPGVQYRAIAVVYGGTEVAVLATEANGWAKIQIPGGAVGYVNGSYLTYK